MDSLPKFDKFVLSNRNVFSPFNFSLDRHNLNLLLGNDLLDILSNFLNSNVIFYNNLPRDLLHNFLFMIVDDFSSNRNSLNDVVVFVLDCFLFERHIVNFALS